MGLGLGFSPSSAPLLPQSISAVAAAPIQSVSFNNHLNKIGYQSLEHPSKYSTWMSTQGFLAWCLNMVQLGDG
jgi:hypothetical protein